MATDEEKLEAFEAAIRAMLPVGGARLEDAGFIEQDKVSVVFSNGESISVTRDTFERIVKGEEQTTKNVKAHLIDKIAR